MSIFDLWLYFVAIPAAQVMFGITAFVIAMGGFAWFITIGGIDKRVHLLVVVVLVFVFSLMSAVLPDDSQMKFLAGAYVTTNIEDIDKLPKNIVNAANAYLESLSEETE